MAHQLRSGHVPGVHEGVEIPDSGTDGFALVNAMPADAGTCYCYPTNSCGIVISMAARLNVVVGPADYAKDGTADFFDYDDFVVAFEAAC